MLLTLFLTLSGWALPVRAEIAPEDLAFFARARPLIDAFVAEQEALYDVRLPFADQTWSVGPRRRGGHLADLRWFRGGRWDVSCRDVNVELKGSDHRRAHFFVRVSHPAGRILAKVPGENAVFELVPTCQALGFAPIDPELVIDGVSKHRLFSDDEFIARATPLIQHLLRLNQKSDRLDPATFALLAKGVDLDDNNGPLGWAKLKLGQRNVACRRVRVYVPDERSMFTGFVSVVYGRDDLAPHIPAEAQSILRDRRSFRPYRFSLVNGCDKDGFFEPATLRLRPARPPVAPPEKCTLEDGPALMVPEPAALAPPTPSSP